MKKKMNILVVAGLITVVSSYPIAQSIKSSPPLHLDELSQRLLEVPLFKRMTQEIVPFDHTASPSQHVELPVNSVMHHSPRYPSDHRFPNFALPDTIQESRDSHSLDATTSHHTNSTSHTLHFSSLGARTSDSSDDSLIVSDQDVDHDALSTTATDNSFLGKSRHHMRSFSHQVAEGKGMEEDVEKVLMDKAHEARLYLKHSLQAGASALTGRAPAYQRETANEREVQRSTMARDAASSAAKAITVGAWATALSIISVPAVIGHKLMHTALATPHLLAGMAYGALHSIQQPLHGRLSSPIGDTRSCLGLACHHVAEVAMNAKKCVGEACGRVARRFSRSQSQAENAAGSRSSYHSDPPKSPVEVEMTSRD